MISLYPLSTGCALVVFSGTSTCQIINLKLSQSVQLIKSVSLLILELSRSLYLLDYYISNFPVHYIWQRTHLKLPSSLHLAIIISQTVQLITSGREFISNCPAHYIWQRIHLKLSSSLHLAKNSSQLSSSLHLKMPTPSSLYLCTYCNYYI